MLHGRVIRVADGDTITVLDSLNQQHRVRLHGIDSPEKGQDFYQVARQFSNSFCFQQWVRVEVLDYDRYQRAIGKVYVGEQELNLALLKSGLAWHYLQFDRSESYAAAEAEAQLYQRGLWANPTRIAPWEFRKLKRRKVSP